MSTLIRKRFDLPPIQNANDKVNGEFELDKHATAVRGLLISANLDQLLFYRGRVEIGLNGQEVIPEDYHAKLLMSGLGVPPKDRYLPTNLEPGNGMFKVTFRDEDNLLAPFQAYQVSIYLEIEINEDAGT